MTSNWLEVLTAEVEKQGTAAVAAKLKVSKATISQVVNNKYKASTKTIQEKVEGAFLAKSVDCPILGEIPTNVCLENQDRKFAATNHIRVQLYKACNGGCPHSKKCGS